MVSLGGKSRGEGQVVGVGVGDGVRVDDGVADGLFGGLGLAQDRDGN